MEKRFHVFERGTDEKSIRLAGELSIACDMVAMVVRMGDDKLQGWMAMVVLPLLHERSHGVTHRNRFAGRRFSSGIEQQSFLGAEEQIQKWRFEIQALALTQDECVRIELEGLKRRVRAGCTVGGAMNPRKRLNGIRHVSRLSCWQNLRQRVNRRREKVAASSRNHPLGLECQ